MPGVCRCGALVALMWSAFVPATAAGQARQTKVSYDVEFSTMGSLLDPTCAATGTDVVSGTLVGLEPALPNEVNEFVGTLTRSTRITICGSRRNSADIDVVCSMSISGNGFPDVILTMNAQGRGAYLQYITNRTDWAHLLPPPPQGPVNSVVNGTCDPAEMAQMQTDYPDGSTAGSPSGQPIEVSGLPTRGFPVSFPPKPPESIWTLKVLARRP